MEPEPWVTQERLGSAGEFDREVLTALSGTSAIGLAILDTQQRFRFVNNAVVAMHNSVPAGAFVGTTVRDIIGDAAPEVEARLGRVLLNGETPSSEVCVMLPTRTE